MANAPLSDRADPRNALMLAGARRKAERGGVLSASFAFELDPWRRGLYRPDPTWRAHIARAFEQSAAGVASTAIAREFSAMGLPTPSEARKLARGRITSAEYRCKWNARMVDAIFDDPMHMGVVIYCKTAVIRDPQTKAGIRRQKRPQDEWLTAYHADLQTVSAELWHAVHTKRHGGSATKTGSVRG